MEEVTEALIRREKEKDKGDCQLEADLLTIESYLAAHLR
jgi:hypothetical protein